MYNQRSVGLFAQIFSDIRLYISCPQIYHSLKLTTANINNQLKAESDFSISIKRLSIFTKKLLEQDGLDFLLAEELTKLLSTNFRKQNIEDKFKESFHRQQTNCRNTILMSLELKALDQGNSKWSKREIAAFECILRTLTGCAYSPVVKSRLEQIRDNPYSGSIAVSAISEFLKRMYSRLDLDLGNHSQK